MDFEQFTPRIIAIALDIGCVLIIFLSARKGSKSSFIAQVSFMLGLLLLKVLNPVCTKKLEGYLEAWLPSAKKDVLHLLSQFVVVVVIIGLILWAMKILKAFLHITILGYLDNFLGLPMAIGNTFIFAFLCMEYFELTIPSKYTEYTYVYSFIKKSYVQYCKSIKSIFLQ